MTAWVVYLFLSTIQSFAYSGTYPHDIGNSRHFFYLLRSRYLHRKGIPIFLSLPEAT